MRVRAAGLGRRYSYNAPFASAGIMLPILRYLNALARQSVKEIEV